MTYGRYLVKLGSEFNCCCYGSKLGYEQARHSSNQTKLFLQVMPQNKSHHLAKFCSTLPYKSDTSTFSPFSLQNHPSNNP